MPQCVINSNVSYFLIAAIALKIRLWIENMTIHSLTNGSSDIITDNRNATVALVIALKGLGLACSV